MSLYGRRNGKSTGGRGAEGGRGGAEKQVPEVVGDSMGVLGHVSVENLFYGGRGAAAPQAPPALPFLLL